MMRFVSMAVLCAVVSTPVFACERPSAPTSIPDGASASKEEMLAAKKAVDAFKSGMEEYFDLREKRGEERGRWSRTREGRRPFQCAGEGLQGEELKSSRTRCRLSQKCKRHRLGAVPFLLRSSRRSVAELLRLVFELLAADRGLIHQPALRHREHRHSLVVIAGRGRIFLSAGCACGSSGRAGSGGC